MRTVVLIDAGHGSDTPGKRSPDSSFREWKWNREVANEIVKALEARNVTVFRIIPEDYELDMPLADRVRRINYHCSSFGAGNCVLISVHANAAGNGTWMKAQGWSAYTTPGKTNSDRVAELLYQEAEKEFKDRRIRRDTSDGDSDIEANFYVIRKAACPAVLTENFFYDNLEECKWLLTEEAKKRIVKVHVQALMRYIIERENG